MDIKEDAEPFVCTQVMPETWAAAPAATPEEMAAKRAEIETKVFLDQAAKGIYTLMELQALGLIGQENVRVKTLPYIMTEHDFQMLDAKITGKCEHCRKTIQELEKNQPFSEWSKCPASMAVRDFKKQQYKNNNNGGGRGGGRGGGWRGRKFGQ